MLARQSRVRARYATGHCCRPRRTATKRRLAGHFRVRAARQSRSTHRRQTMQMTSKAVQEDRLDGAAGVEAKRRRVKTRSRARRGNSASSALSTRAASLACAVSREEMSSVRAQARSYLPRPHCSQRRRATPRPLHRPRLRVSHFRPGLRPERRLPRHSSSCVNSPFRGRSATATTRRCPAVPAGAKPLGFSAKRLSRVVKQHSCSDSKRSPPY